MTAIHNFLLKPWIYVVIVLFGTSLKFYNLNHKLFWLDEIYSIVYTSGITDNTILESIPVNEIKSYSYYDNILHLSNKNLSLKNEVAGILSDTHLTPSHYVFLTVWYQLVGDDEIDYRLFSVFIFILSLPFIFLLGKTLYNTNLAGWITTSLYAVSPFIHYYSQEARYYELWVFFFIACNYFFLQAIKNNKAIWWIGYSATAILACYTSATSGLFIFGHLIYILVLKKELRLKYIISMTFIILAYLPWMYFLYTVRQTIENGLAWHKGFNSSFFSLDLIFLQLLGFVKSFSYLFDAGVYWALTNGVTTTETYFALFIDLVLLVFIVYAIFYLFTKTSKEIRWFLILIILPLFLIFYISDVIRNGFTSLLWRYQIVNMVGIILIVTNLLNDKIIKARWLYISIYFGLVFIALGSVLKISECRCWNTSPDCESNIEDAQLISNAAHPLVITDFSGAGFGTFLAILNDSKAKNADIMYCKGIIPNLKEKIAGRKYSEIYVMAASDILAQKIKLQFGKNMVPYVKQQNPFSQRLWKIKL